MTSAEVIPNVVYALCALTSVVCAALLWRSWMRSRQRLLLVSALGFAGLAINNILLFVDVVLTGPSVDLSLPRAQTAIAAMLVLVVGLVWEAR
jgi:hypothetical protein